MSVNNPGAIYTDIVYDIYHYLFQPIFPHFFAGADAPIDGQKGGDFVGAPKVHPPRSMVEKAHAVRPFRANGKAAPVRDPGYYLADDET
jgi:hypothetical protein